MAEQVTKIDIFSGFLGAGKTTLIKKLIKEAFQGEKIVLIENEFGEIGIDGGFMREAGIQVNELNSGCICCSLVGDFREALKKVVETYHPDRILIEPSGVGKLSDVTRAVEGVGETLPVSLNSFVTVADVNKVKMYMKNFGEFYDDQISHASCIILSRTGSADEKKVAAAVALIQEKNPTATIVTTDWNELTGAQIVSVMDGKRDLVAELLSEAQASNAAHADEDEEEHHHHHHDHDEDGHECCHHHHDHDDDDDDEDEHEHHHHHDEDDDHGHECCHHHHDHDDDDDDDEHEHHHHHHDEDEHDHDHCCHHHDHDDDDDDDHDHEHCCHHHHDEDEHDHDHHHHHHDGEECDDPHCGCHHHHHHADEVFTSWGTETVKAYSEAELEHILTALDSGEYGAILRAKGIVAAADGGQWLHYDFVPEEHQVRRGPADYTGRICVIGSQLKEDKLSQLFGL